MFGECHAHVFMDGVNYREAVRRQERGVREDWIRHVFEQYVKNEIFYVREEAETWKSEQETGSSPSG